MFSEKQRFQIFVALGIVAVFTLLPLAARASNGESLPADQFQTNAAGTGTAFRETVNARLTNVKGTAEAVGTNAASTAQAARTKVAGTSTAIGEKAIAARTNVAGTATAFREKVNATGTAARAKVYATSTSFKATLDTVRTVIPATAIAAKATINAASTSIKATVSAGGTSFMATAKAAGTKVATVFAPLADPKTAIEFYAKNVLGTEVVVVSARRSTSSDGKRFSNTDSGGQINQIGLGFASVSNYATLTNGEAMVSYGLAGAINQNLEAGLAAASVGVYSLNVGDTGTLDSEKALTLAKNTYPKLSGYDYKPVITQKGYAWIYSKGKTENVPQSLDAGGGMIIFYVLPTSTNKAKVTVTVALGGFAAMSP